MVLLFLYINIASYLEIFDFRDMLLRCNKCGCLDILPSYKRCPQCGQLLSLYLEDIKQKNNYNINNTTMAPFTTTKHAPDLEMVKNTVLWNLNPGEVARRINVSEFANMTNARGVYVQEGVIAVLMIDGRIVTQLSSGVYYFPTYVERFGETVRHIWRFFAGKKENGGTNEDEIRKGRLGSELQNLGQRALIDVVLMTEGVIPIVLGIEISNGITDFTPFVIQTNLADINVAVSMNLEISDFYKFRVNYLTKNTSCRVHDLQTALNNPIRNTIQETLAYENIEAAIFPPEIKERLKRNIISKANSVLFGVQVAQIIDITLNSEDFNRFREIEHKLYCSKKELEYLIRTNDFKNRLQDEENAQIIKEAKSEEELRYALNKLNKDKLLHDDEVEAFCQLLASQKAIRTAQTDADIEKALLGIKKSSLIAQDDFEALESELRVNKHKRDEVEEIFRWQSLTRTESERISAQKDVSIRAAHANKEIEQAVFERDEQEQGHRQTLEIKEAQHISDIGDICRAERRKEDDYINEQRVKRHKTDLQIDTERLNYDDDKERRRIERARIAGNDAIDLLSRIKEEERKDTDQVYKREETLKKIDLEAQISLAEIKRGMSAEQLAASNLENLSEAGQVALAEAISSHKELDWLKTSTEERIKIIQDFSERIAANDREHRQMQEKIMDKMMDFASRAIETNASLVSGAVQNQRETTNQILSTVKDVSTHRLEEVEGDKREYKEQAHHAQNRLDHTQDTALHYTTSRAKSEVAADAIKNSDQSSMTDIIRYNIVAYGAGFFTSLADILAMINNGDITPDTELNVNGHKCNAYQRDELRSALDRKYGAQCPKCGADGLMGYTCPECGCII